MRRRDLITLAGDSPFFPVDGTSSLRCLSVHATPQSFSGANTSWLAAS